MLLAVVDHDDRRNNETNYRLAAQVTFIAAWVLFGSAIVLALLRGEASDDGPMSLCRPHP